MRKYEILIAITLLVLGAAAFIGDGWTPTAVLGQEDMVTPMESETYLGVAMHEDNGWYVSDAVEAPIPFNAVVPEWTDDHSIFFEFRTGVNGRWTEWIPLHHSHDLSDGEQLGAGAELGMAIGEMFFVPAADGTHTAVQFRTTSPISAIPTLKLTAIDSTDGPTGEDLLQRQQELDALTAGDTRSVQANEKPTVISRDVWCTDSRCDCPPGGCGNTCSDNDPLRYRNTTHMVVHHTVSSNSSANWAATVRAIWNYHTFGQCWGDIGYNYLIDMNGVIYEGHRGGDDVIGSHASGANPGSMGVALIGTFSTPSEYPVTMVPPPAMQNSLINLLAWKADQQQIDVYGASEMRDLYGGRPHLMGHRDVYGTTQCPGGYAHALLPDIRDAVASRLDFIPFYNYIDELDNNFTQSNSNWREPIYNCGYNTHSYYTFSTSNQNATPYWGEWVLDAAEDGLYEIEVFVPYCNTGDSETQSANYTIYHSGGTSNVVVNQEERVGLWTSLGSYWLAKDSDHRVRLTDITNDDNRGVWFDTVRIRPVDAPASFQINSPDDASTWLTSKHVDFSWEGINLADSSDIRLEVARDINFTDLIIDETFGSSANSATRTMPSNGDAFYWRVSATVNGEFIVSPIGEFKIDDEAPQAAISGVYRFDASDRYLVVVEASDNMSGIASITIQYREVDGSSWETLVTGTQASGITFSPPDNTLTYEFRVQAADAAGNVRPYSDTGEASSDEAIMLSNSLFLPAVRN